MEIDFRSEVLSPVPVELGLTLLRGAQEAMFNAMKYSGVRRAEVQVLERGSEIQFVVRDAGRGFDVKEAGGKGLGLTSMRERVRLVNGRITIDSRTMGGTRVEVHLPLTSMPNSHRAAV